jgi:hypothetical protein
MTYQPYNTISLESYAADQSDRVKAEDIHQNDAYLFRALLERRSGVAAGEFLAIATSVQQTMGRTALATSLFESGESSAPLLVFNSSVEDNFLEPERQNINVTHPRTGSIGILKEGYLLSDPRVPSRIGRASFQLLDSDVYPIADEYIDLRTNPLEPVRLGYN